MGLFPFLSTKPETHLGWLGVDIHVHLLPGIDDGCVDMETTMQCLQGLNALGLHTLYCTPHIYPGKFPNTKAGIQAAIAILEGHVCSLLAPVPYTLRYAAEYMMDEGFPDRYTPQDLLLLGDRHLLVELPFATEPLYAESYIFQLRTRNLQPILAHPERYAYYHHHRARIRRFAELGCELQVNLLSLAGYYGPDVKRMALWMVREQLVDYVATDLHHLQHLEALIAYCTRTDTEKLLRHNPIKNKQLADGLGDSDTSGHYSKPVK